MPAGALGAVSLSAGICSRNRLLVRNFQSRPASELKVCLDLPKVIAADELFPANLTAIAPTSVTKVKVKELKIHIN